MRTGDFSLLYIVQNGSRDHSALFSVGKLRSSPSGKASKREADYSSPSRDEAKSGAVNPCLM